MTTKIDNEMNSCLSDLEQIQSKLQELQKTKEKTVAAEKGKIEDLEPNMAVLATWLMKKNERIEQNINIKNYDSFMTSGENTSIGEDERRVIVENGLRCCQRGGITQVPTFHTKIHRYPDIPSEFMAEFIEATYNLFQIQQKRIDELELELHA